jgi:hypothetical protein
MLSAVKNLYVVTMCVLDLVGGGREFSQEIRVGLNDNFLVCV